MARREGAQPADVGKALAQQAQAGVITGTAAAPDEFAKYVERYRTQIADSLPAGYGGSAQERYVRFLRVLTTEVRRNPELLLPARRKSLLAAMVLSAQLGLEPGPSQRVYFVPYGDEVQFQLGWRGIMELAYRSGTVRTIGTQVVRHGDAFDYGIKNFEPYMLYRPMDTGDDRPMEKVFAYVTYTNGSSDIEVMTRAQVDTVMRRSKAARAVLVAGSKDTWQATKGPWSTDYDEMARKTVLKRLCKRVPMSEQDKRALERDEVTVASIEPDMLAVPDARSVAVDMWAPPEPPEPNVQHDAAADSDLAADCVDAEPEGGPVWPGEGQEQLDV